MDEVRFGMNQYCGPAVLSIFTGLDTDTCAEAISKVTGNYKVTGVYPKDLIKAADALGVSIVENEAFKGRSLFWAASALTHFHSSLWLVTIPKHYIAIEVAEDGAIQICDNHTKEPIDLQNSSRLSQKVEAVYKVKRYREYIKPVLTEATYEVWQAGSRVMIERIHKFSDGTEKKYAQGSFEAPMDRRMFQELAFKIMELSKEGQ